MIPVNAVLRAITTFNLADLSQAQNVFHLLHLSAEEKTDEDVLDAVGAWVAGLYETMAAHISTGVSLTKTEVYIYETPVWNPVGVAVGSWVGDSASERLPAGVAPLLHAYKARSGYSDKKYIPGFVEAASEGDVMTSTAQTACEAGAAYWIAQYVWQANVTLLPVHWGRVSLAAAAYVSSAVGTYLAYQRRRKPGVGLT